MADGGDGSGVLGVRWQQGAWEGERTREMRAERAAVLWNEKRERKIREKERNKEREERWLFTWRGEKERSEERERNEERERKV